MKIFRTILLLKIALFAGICTAQAQHSGHHHADKKKDKVKTLNVLFDKQGQVEGFLPQHLKETDLLSFYVKGSDYRKEQQKLLLQKALTALEHIKQVENDENLLAILQFVYDINITQLQAMESDYAKFIDSPDTYKPAYLPQLPADNNFYTIKTEDTKTANNITLPENFEVPFKYPCSLIFPDQNLLNITLTRSNLYNKAVFVWAKTTGASFTPISADNINSLKEYQKEINVQLNIVNRLIKNAKKAPANYHAQFTQLVSEVNDLYTNITQKAYLNGDCEWIKNWFWYESAPMPALNPFQFCQDQDIIPDTSHLAAIRATMKYYQGLLNSASSSKDDAADNATPSNPKKTPTPTPKSSSGLTANQVYHYAHLIDSCSQLMDNQMKAFQNATLLRSQNKKLIDSFCFTSSILNRFKLFVSSSGDAGPIYWMRHHNAANSDEVMDSIPRKEYQETDHVVVLTHNLKYNQQAGVSLTYQPITNDQSQIGDLFTSLVTDLSGSPDNSVPGIDSYFNIVPRRPQTTLEIPDSTVASLQGEKTTLLLLQNIAKYVIAQKNPELALLEKTDTASVYHSYSKISPPIIGSQLVKYTVPITQTGGTATAASAGSSGASNTKAGPSSLTITATATTAGTPSSTPSSVASGAGSSIKPDTFIYRQNKLYRAYPMAGFAVTLNNFVSVPPNAAGNGPGLPSSQSQVNYIAGIKFFFEKTDIRNTNFIWQNDQNGHSLWLSRIHFDLAVDIGNPLNNIYTGFGIDPLPGAAINFGVVWNRYNYYQYAGNQEINNRMLYRPGFYLGLTTDASAVAQIIKLFK